MPKQTRITPAHGNPAFGLRHRHGAARTRRGTGAFVIRFKPAALAPLAVERPGLRRIRAFAELPSAVGDPLRWLKANYGLQEVKPLFALPAASATARLMRDAPTEARATLAVQASVHEAPLDSLRGYSVVHCDPKNVDSKLLRSLSQAQGVEFVETVPERWLSARGRSTPRPDPQRNNQWGLRAIGWFDQRLPATSDVEVGILDSGIDMTHPDLKRVVAAYDHGKYSAEDLIGHGTHVAGIVAAMANNGVGIAGVAPCRLRMWKVFSDTPTSAGDLCTDDETYLRALGHAAASSVRVVNLSLGGYQASRAERELIDTLIGQGKIVIAAMGNEFEDGDPTEYPAAYRNVIAVGALTVGMRRAAFSNTGRHITLAAPGKHILSTLPMKRSAFRAADEVEYAYWDGTSMAAPCVAGCIALALARRPGIDAAALLKAMPHATRKIAAMKKKSFTREFGYGLVHIPTLFRATDRL